MDGHDLLSEQARISSESDPLSLILQRHGLDTRLAFSGRLCGSAHYPESAGEGCLHLLKSGSVILRDELGQARKIRKPSLILWTRRVPHSISPTEPEGADVVCARLSFGADDSNPLLIGFPNLLIVAFDELPGLEAVLTLLFAESLSESVGRKATVDLLLRLLIVMLLRLSMREGWTDMGLLAGMSDPRLYRVIDAIHRSPNKDWTVERLADVAGMSRATFAAVFKGRIGIAPVEYLTSVRLAIAKARLRAGRPLKEIARDVGYGSVTALSRSFRRQFECSPRDWLNRERVLPPAAR